MSVLGVVLVLAAAVCHATWNVFVKKINAGPELVWLFSAISVAIYLPFAIFFAASHGSFNTSQMLFMAGSSALHLGYFLLLQFGYRRGDLSLIYPTARATGPLLATVFAVIVLGESLTLRIAIGGVIIIFGVLMLTGGIRRSSRNTLVSAGFGVATGFLISSYTVWDAHAVAALAVPPLLLDYASNASRFVLLAPVAYRRRAAVVNCWRDHKIGVLAIAIFSPLAYILVLTALTFTPVVIVAPMREVSVVLTVIAGSVFLGEGSLRHRAGWAIVILVGVAILATST